MIQADFAPLLMQCFTSRVRNEPLVPADFWRRDFRELRDWSLWYQFSSVADCLCLKQRLRAHLVDHPPDSGTWIVCSYESISRWIVPLMAKILYIPHDNPQRHQRHRVQPQQWLHRRRIWNKLRPCHSRRMVWSSPQLGLMLNFKFVPNWRRRGCIHKQ